MSTVVYEEQVFQKSKHRQDAMLLVDSVDSDIKHLDAENMSSLLDRDSDKWEEAAKERAEPKRKGNLVSLSCARHTTYLT